MSGNKIILAVAILALALLIGLQMRTSKRLQTLETERNSLAEVVTAQGSELEQLKTETAAAKSRSPNLDPSFPNLVSASHSVSSPQTGPGTAARLPSTPIATSQPIQQRVAELEERIRQLTNAALIRPAVPEYNVLQPPTQLEPTGQPAVANAPSNAVPKRSWGQEQMLGPPDTHQSGDIPTAWASVLPDGGAEWLWLDFDKASQLAEVRIRETFNPGAISKVTAMSGGQEIVLWEGTANTGPAPRDFVVPVDQNISAQSIVVHMDTKRVPGWNEIDAVELVGRDGSRQWASGANASSTYAERPPTPQPVGTSQTNSMNLR